MGNEKELQGGVQIGCPNPTFLPKRKVSGKVTAGKTESEGGDSKRRKPLPHITIRMGDVVGGGVAKQQKGEQSEKKGRLGPSDRAFLELSVGGGGANRKQKGYLEKLPGKGWATGEKNEKKL